MPPRTPPHRPASSASSSTAPATASRRSSSPPGFLQGSVFNDEYRHTSLIATLRKVWNLGEPLTQRDASARTFDDLFTLGQPRNPETWATVAALPVPKWHLDEDLLNKGLSGLGKTIGPGIIEHAREIAVDLPPQVDDPNAELTPAIMAQVSVGSGWPRAWAVSRSVR